MTEKTWADTRLHTLFNLFLLVLTSYGLHTSLLGCDLFHCCPFGGRQRRELRFRKSVLSNSGRHLP